MKEFAKVGWGVDLDKGPKPIYQVYIGGRYFGPFPKETAFDLCQTINTLAFKYVDGAVQAERERCISKIFGLCSSDNEAQRIADAIRSGE